MAAAKKVRALHSIVIGKGVEVQPGDIFNPGKEYKYLLERGDIEDIVPEEPAREIATDPDPIG